MPVFARRRQVTKSQGMQTQAIGMLMREAAHKFAV
jgi:hypothetical protein